MPLADDSSGVFDPTLAAPLGDELPRIVTSVPGAQARAWCDRLADVECPALTMRRARRREQSGASHDPIVWQAARGANVVDVDGNVYVDMTAGFGAALVGHGHPSVVRAVQSQAAVMMHALGDVHPSGLKIELEARLAAIAPWPDARVILGLSGSDAIEAALKTAWLHTRRTRVIAFTGAYHGLSLASGQLCGYRQEFAAPFATAARVDVEFAPYPGLHDPAVRQHAEQTCRRLAAGDVAAIVLEPILGRGGVCQADVASVDAIVSAARAVGTVVIADEVLTGAHRAGAECMAVSAATWATAPDVICLGKALGGNLPISACVMRDEIAEAWGAPTHEALHTSTFLGNPLACAASLATLDVIGSAAFREQWSSTVRQLWAKTLEPLASDAALAIDRLDGAGLLAGVHLRGGAPRALRVMRRLLERGFIVLTAGATGACLSLTPPVGLTPAQFEAFGTELAAALRADGP